MDVPTWREGGVEEGAAALRVPAILGVQISRGESGGAEYMGMCVEDGEDDALPILAVLWTC